MGLFEQARNITDTDLRLVLTESSQPVDALKKHILKLEASLRELVRGEEYLVKQREWLDQAVERNLKLAEQSEARAARMLELGREEEARGALLEKRESLGQMSADRRQLEREERTLTDLRRQRRQLEQRIDQARRIRVRMAAGEPLSESDLHPVPSEPPAEPEPVRPAPELSPGDEDELTKEIERLRRQSKGPPRREDRA